MQNEDKVVVMYFTGPVSYMHQRQTPRYGNEQTFIVLVLHVSLAVWVSSEAPQAKYELPNLCKRSPHSAVHYA